ncbi:uncharacterized protein [Physcomitrium patens]|uniref:Uncharacterized protein n=1 Tax=Physcomitrium patens TaxID=3218 RepID=A0A2K1JJ95_PHYPA|nr:dentin sialophosphoprotein-like [Physcomitrium patens]XP_024395565.1 dentin sialophosphoprotein-like [Physcomitrium patens]XP_024395566.1 dentin sialophosphoprotein-like [Physcomitrium patens]XP_024395567.1 dentin sialophosphoprotein-like [Physcomitrium patens]PNR41620.1 hypothetical protein PHYPA_019024 [Physcomitrium patens]|eukprot:XP_024395564.1 dentin sialophosphoprotein-like [Physcomitrella patens]
MGAESIALVEESIDAQLRKPDKAEVLDFALLDKPVKEDFDFGNSNGSSDSILSTRTKDKLSQVPNDLKPESEPESVGNGNVDADKFTAGEVTTKDADKTDVDTGKRSTSFELADNPVSITSGDALPPTPSIEEDTHIVSTTSEDDDAALEAAPSIVQESPVRVSIASVTEDMEDISLDNDQEQSTTPAENVVVSPESQLGGDNSKAVESSNIQSTQVEGQALLKKSSPQLVTNRSNSDDPDAAGGSTKQIATLLKAKADDSDVADRISNQNATVLKEDSTAELQSSTANLPVGEGSIKQDASITTEAPAAESQLAIKESPVAELQVQAETIKPVKRIEHEYNLASATESLPTSRFASASEIQEASEPAIPPPARTGSSVIRLTRQMSQVSVGMGPMSPRFELRAAKEIQNLQEKVKNLEEMLRRKCAALETQSINHVEKENELLNKVKCLELANEQLLQGGNDSSIQLQMELTRLQRQNSMLQLRERELQFQFTQEMMKTQILDTRPTKPEPINLVEDLESKVAVLESKLAEAVEVRNMYKLQLHEAFTRQNSVQSAALLNLDGDDVLKELQKLRKQTKDLEAELLDLQDRFFITTVRVAEAAAQKEELLSKLKRLQGSR